MRYYTFENVNNLFESTPRTLYHGTLREYLPSIKRYELWPSVGEFTRHWYSEYEEAGIKLPELIFAADRKNLRKCVSAILGAMRQKNIPWTEENFFNNAAIVVFKHGEPYFQHRQEDNYNFDPEGKFPTVEPGDYYREDAMFFDFFLTGKKLMNFLKRNGAYPENQLT